MITKPTQALHADHEENPQSHLRLEDECQGKCQGIQYLNFKKIIQFHSAVVVFRVVEWKRLAAPSYGPVKIARLSDLSVCCQRRQTCQGRSTDMINIGPLFSCTHNRQPIHLSNH